MEEPNQMACAAIHFVCSIEAFIGKFIYFRIIACTVESLNTYTSNITFLFIVFAGVLWSGICGAVIFSKVVRLTAMAPVAFSDPITVRYGTGVLPPSSDHETENKNDLEKQKTRYLCPILTFRLVNLHSDRKMGEIVDASINVVAIVNGKLPEKKNEEKATTVTRQPSVVMKSFSEGMSSLMRPNQATNIKPFIIQDDPGSTVENSRYFTKLEIDAPENPLFSKGKYMYDQIVFCFSYTKFSPFSFLSFTSQISLASKPHP